MNPEYQGTSIYDNPEAVKLAQMLQQQQANTSGTIQSGFMQPQNPQPCPTCGTCPTCGRKGYQTYPHLPYWLYPNTIYNGSRSLTFQSTTPPIIQGT